MLSNNVSIHSAQLAMMEHFVPFFLGFNHIKHNEFAKKKKNTYLAKELFAIENGTSIVI
jgi:hypothetical protein